MNYTIPQFKYQYLMKTIFLSATLLLTLPLMAQVNLTGLYRVSLSGAAYATDVSPNKSLLRGTSYFVVEQVDDKITINWGGLSEKLPPITLIGRVGKGHVVASKQFDGISTAITATLIGGRITGRFITYYFGAAVSNPGWTTLRFNATKINEDCTALNVNTLTVKTKNDKALLTDGLVDLAVFEKRKEATEAKKILKDLKINTVCKITQPYPSFIFFMVDNTLPDPSISLDNCITLQPALLHTQRVSGIWTVLHDTKTLFPCKSRQEAQTAIAIMKFRKATRFCTLGSKKELKLIFK